MGLIVLLGCTVLLGYAIANPIIRTAAQETISQHGRSSASIVLPSGDQKVYDLPILKDSTGVGRSLMQQHKSHRDSVHQRIRKRGRDRGDGLDIVSSEVEDNALQSEEAEADGAATTTATPCNNPFYDVGPMVGQWYAMRCGGPSQIECAATDLFPTVSEPLKCHNSPGRPVNVSFLGIASAYKCVTTLTMTINCGQGSTTGTGLFVMEDARDICKVLSCYPVSTTVSPQVAVMQTNQVQLLPGISGTVGIAGATGPTGAQGAKGPTGLAGAVGDAGGTGPKGADGIAGLAGHNGVNAMTPDVPAGLSPFFYLYVVFVLQIIALAVGFGVLKGVLEQKRAASAKASGAQDVWDSAPSGGGSGEAGQTS